MSITVNTLGGCTTLEEAIICNDNNIHKVTVIYIDEYTQSDLHWLRHAIGFYIKTDIGLFYQDRARCFAKVVLSHNALVQRTSRLVLSECI